MRRRPPTALHRLRGDVVRLPYMRPIRSLTRLPDHGAVRAGGSAVKFQQIEDVLKTAGGRELTNCVRQMNATFRSTTDPRRVAVRLGFRAPSRSLLPRVAPISKVVTAIIRHLQRITYQEIGCV